ncbi:uncharacterized protein LOC142333199 [Lycorma delicatula]|uniref:uncharacterized protein LOC142333199 n=1 Tax=Lycorma delicatula TaxID=130591 RepID=UPI003F516B4D
MLLKQNLLIHIIMAILVCRIVAEPCDKCKDKSYNRDIRASGHTNKKEYFSLSDLFCEYFKKKRHVIKHYFFLTCAYRMDKYFKKVGETEEDVIKYVNMCLQKKYTWYQCVNIISYLEEECWDMHITSHLMEIINDKEFVYELALHKTIATSYLVILEMKNFQPLLCKNEILTNSFIREEVFRDYYEQWYMKNPSAKGCTCKTVIDIYQRLSSPKEQNRTFTIECM